MLSTSELACIADTVAASLDTSLPVTRRTATPDGYGHTTEVWNSVGSVAMNLIKPSATQLQAFAGIIGSQRAMLIRVMQTSDVREGDHIAYDGLAWLVQNVQNAESYTVTKEYLITVIT